MLLALLAWSVADAQTPPAAPKPAAPAPAPAPKPATPAAPAGPPTVAPCTVLQPTYTIDGKNPNGAFPMFAVKSGDKTVLVTSYSMFGPGGGLPAVIPGGELAKHVTAATAKDAFNPATVCAKIKRAYSLPDAVSVGGGHDMTKDVAVFEIDTDTSYAAQTTAPVPLAPLTLATKAPKLNDRVYVLTHLNNQTANAFPAKVVQSDAGYVFFQFDDATLDLTGSPGSPVVDATGALIGVDVAGQKTPDGLIGGCTPLAATKARIDAALASK